MIPRARLVLLTSVLAGVLAGAGCAPPMPVIPAPNKTIDYRGERRKLDLRFLQPGTTTREDVQRELAWADTGLNRPSVFWGRWQSSSFLDLNRSVGEQRILWRGQNLLVEFDNSGHVMRYQTFGDKALLAAINDWLSRAPQAVHESGPQTVLVRPGQPATSIERELRLVLAKDFLTLEGAPPVPVPRIRRLVCTGSGANPVDVRLSVYFAESTGAEGKLRFEAQVSDVVTLTEFLRWTQPDALHDRAR